ncbi:MAG TPA: MFS transporter [Pyrinomonadaceae bacterium]|nr:MFS transporter [Pyrinomonadaceae bacterium]
MDSDRGFAEPTSMRSFFIIWSGQICSRVGSALTAFALSVWVYQQVGSITRFALVSLCYALPVVLVAPFAGALVDRWNRRRAMLVGDVGAALSVLSLSFLYFSGRLELWHIYAGTAMVATFGALQSPAYSSSVTLLVPKKQLGRANGMVQLGMGTARVGAPILGGILLVTFNLGGVLLIDLATFVFAISTLIAVRIPNVRQSVEGQRRSFLGDVAYAGRYLFHRWGLMSLMILYGVCNFIIGLVSVLVVPMVLALGSSVMLGTVLSIGGVGMLIGALLMSVVGGARRKVLTILSFIAVMGFCIAAAGLRPAAAPIAIAGFGLFFSLSLINSTTPTIVQTKVAVDVQGRVFALLTMIAWAAYPLAYPLAGPLAERIFEPLMAVNGPLAGSVGHVIGVGPGRGIALFFITLGVMMMAIALAGYLYPRLRNLEEEMPDAVVPPRDERQYVSATTVDDGGAARPVTAAAHAGAASSRGA